MEPLGAEETFESPISGGCCELSVPLVGQVWTHVALSQVQANILPSRQEYVPAGWRKSAFQPLRPNPASGRWRISGPLAEEPGPGCSGSLCDAAKLELGRIELSKGCTELE